MWFGRKPRRPAEELISDARALVKDGRIEEAIRVYRKIRRRDLTAETLVEVGRACFQLKDFFGAAEYAARALDLDPSCAPAVCIHGACGNLNLARRSIYQHTDPPGGSACPMGDRSRRSPEIAPRVFRA